MFAWPPLGTLFTWAERAACDAPLLRNLGGFLILVARKRRPAPMTASASAAARRACSRPNDADDPLPYYYNRWVGWLYRHRLQMGLDLLPAGGRRVLEVGVGSGVLVPTLTGALPPSTPAPT